MQSELTLPLAHSPSRTRTATVVAALLAAFFGVFLLWGVGFSHLGVLHNAAHDTRHSNAFPCH